MTKKERYTSQTTKDYIKKLELLKKVNKTSKIFIKVELKKKLNLTKICLITLFLQHRKQQSQGIERI